MSAMSFMNNSLNRACRPIAFIGLMPTSTSESRPTSDLMRLVCRFECRRAATSSRFSDITSTKPITIDSTAAFHDTSAATPTKTSAWTACDTKTAMAL